MIKLVCILDPRLKDLYKDKREWIDTAKVKLSELYVKLFATEISSTKNMEEVDNASETQKPILTDDFYNTYI